MESVLTIVTPNPITERKKNQGSAFIVPNMGSSRWRHMTISDLRAEAVGHAGSQVEALQSWRHTKRDFEISSKRISMIVWSLYQIIAG